MGEVSHTIEIDGNDSHGLGLTRFRCYYWSILGDQGDQGHGLWLSGHLIFYGLRICGCQGDQGTIGCDWSILVIQDDPHSSPRNLRGSHTPDTTHGTAIYAYSIDPSNHPN